MTGVDALTGPPHPVTGRVPPRGRRWCHATAKSTGKQCQQLAIEGGTVCARYHGGAAGQVRRKAKERVAYAQAEEAVAARMRLGAGQVDEATPDAMLRIFRELLWDELVLRQLVAGLDAAAPAVADGPGSEADPPVLWMANTIAGPTGSTSKLNDAAPHVWVVMHQQARRDVMTFGKMIRDCGIEEARLELDRADTQRMVRVVRGITEAALGLVLDVVAEAEPELAGRVRARWVEGLPGIIRAQVRALDAGTAA